MLITALIMKQKKEVKVGLDGSGIDGRKADNGPDNGRRYWLVQMVVASVTVALRTALIMEEKREIEVGVDGGSIGGSGANNLPNQWNKEISGNSFLLSDEERVSVEPSSGVSVGLSDCLCLPSVEPFSGGSVCLFVNLSVECRTFIWRVCQSV